MKQRIIALITAFIMIVALTACQKVDEKIYASKSITEEVEPSLTEALNTTNNSTVTPTATTTPVITSFAEPTPVMKDNKSVMYQQAVDYIKEKHYPQAIGILQDLGDYEASSFLLKQLRYIINGCYISNGQWAVGAITSTGGVAIACDNEYSDRYSAVESWRDIKAICFRSGDSIEGLTHEGKIITTSDVTEEELLSSSVTSNYACAQVVKAVTSWKDIEYFQDYYPQSAIALTKQGYVYSACSFTSDADGTYPLTDWNSIIAVADGGCFVAGLKSDGTVVATGNIDYFGKCKVSEWTDIVAIDMGGYFSIGLRSDGTMVLAGDCSYSGANTPDLSSMKNLYVPQVDLN